MSALSEICSTSGFRDADVTQVELTPADAYFHWLRDFRPLLDENFWKTFLEGWQQPASLRSQLELEGNRNSEKSKPAFFEFELDLGIVKKLGEISSSCNVTLNNIFQAAFGLSLGTFQDSDDVLFGVIRSCRRTVPEGDRIVSLLMNTLPFRVNANPKMGIHALFSAVKKTHRELRPHEHASSEEILKASGFQNAALFESVFNFQSSNDLRPPIRVLGREIKTDFFMNTEMLLDCVVINGERIIVELRSRPGGFCKDWLEGFAMTFRSILIQISESADRAVSSLALVSKEQKQFLQEVNNTSAQQDNDCTVFELFDAQVRRTPDAVALISGGVTIQYQQLHSLSNRIAEQLLASSIARGDRVAVGIPPGIVMTASLLAVMRCGGVFILLDLSDPLERLQNVLQDSGASILLQQNGSAQFLGSRELICLEVETTDAAKSQPSNTVNFPTVRSNDAGYLIYTSGSSGAPKGVVALHQGLVNRLIWGKKAFPFLPGEACLQKTRVSFVDFVAELFLPLVSGIPLFFADEVARIDVRLLVEALGRFRISRITLVPSLLESMIDSFENLGERLPQLRLWFVSGEPLSRHLAERFHVSVPGGRLVNLYGASEFSADSHFYKIERTFASQRVPIGNPISNMRGYVLNRHLQQIPPSVPGLLYVAGHGLGRGYWRNQEKTDQAFIQHIGLGERLFATGDRVRYLANGALECLGRDDRQIKIRGMRVSLDDIESQLRQIPTVTQAAAICKLSKRRGMQIVAYVKASQSVESRWIRDRLSRLLPTHMVPTHYVQLETLPLLSNGKIDRSSLPEFDWDDHRLLAGAHQPPSGETEKRLFSIWQECFGEAALGVHDDFFELGGHSLLAAKLLKLVETNLGIYLSFKELVGTPTIFLMARHILAHGAKDALTSDTTNAGPFLQLKPSGRGRPLLVLHAVFGDITYARHFATRLKRALPVYGIQPIPLEVAETLPRDLRHLAMIYTRQIRTRFPEGPYLLAGYSFGGLLAFEIAQQLISEGQEVAFLGMIDTYYRLPRWYRALKQLMSKGRLSYLNQHRHRIAAKAKKKHTDTSKTSGITIDSTRETYKKIFLEMVKQYRPLPYSGEINFFAQEHFANEHRRRWKSIALGGLRIIKLSGSHEDLTALSGRDALAHHFDESLGRALDRREG